ncbi:hypothetical protein [Rudanella lutea]|uniref:hypothetical protein n=1 Tax=Rudanella lutea TaxID=451374 RepID=UPI000381A70D|nr:hypothetical protein [Rudanella lutea]
MAEESQSDTGIDWSKLLKLTPTTGKGLLKIVKVGGEGARECPRDSDGFGGIAKKREI